MKLQALLAKYPPYNTEAVRAAYELEIAANKSKVIVLDDDPTGVQTVHGVYVYTDWTRKSIRQGLSDDGIFFILTNSRSLTATQTQRLHQEIAQNLLEETDDFILVSRSDSTLRGHWSLETETLNAVMTDYETGADGEIICPFFPQGGRYTADNIHYMAQDGELIPVGETEFAADRTFGYHNSDLTEWIEEKSGGRFRADGVGCITLDMLRAGDYDAITRLLCRVNHFCKVVVNALTYDDLMVFATAFFRAKKTGKRFIVRSAAALAQVLGGVKEKPLLDAEFFRRHALANGGLIVVGSHVKRTTEQLGKLRERCDIAFVEMDQHLAIDPPAFQREFNRVLTVVSEHIASGKTAAVFTRRERFDVNTGNREDELRLAATISGKLTGIVEQLKVRPSFIIGKGGITSSDIGTHGLRVQRALVAGQVLPGVPVWLTGEESRFPGLPYVIFPGNVGDAEALARVVEMMV